MWVVQLSNPDCETRRCANLTGLGTLWGCEGVWGGGSIGALPLLAEGVSPVPFKITRVILFHACVILFLPASDTIGFAFNSLLADARDNDEVDDADSITLLLYLAPGWSVGSIIRMGSRGHRM